MRYLLLVFVLFFVQVECLAQKVEKIYLDKSDTTKNSYLIIYAGDNITKKGYMVLVPSFGEAPEEVLVESDLPIKAANQGILTIIPTFSTGVMSVGIDSASQHSFKDILITAVDKHNLQGLPLYIGGFSIGGSAVIKFAENAQRENFQIKPAAVFAVDPPLDFERLYKSSKRTVRLSVNTDPVAEAVYLIQRLEKELGGSPGQVISKYYNFSPYSFTDTSQYAVKSLVSVPLRIYTEPDINWFLKEHGIDFYSLNAFDAAAMVNELNRLGNEKAELIITSNKGYRKSDNSRNPHSWSIINAEELIEWLFIQQ